MLGSVGSAGSGLLNSLLPSGVAGTSGYQPGALNQLQSLYGQLFGSSSGSSNGVNVSSGTGNAGAADNTNLTGVASDTSGGGSGGLAD